MKVIFNQTHTLKENRKTYKKGESENVSSSIAARLKKEGLIEKEKPKAEGSKDPKPKETK